MASAAEVRELADWIIDQGAWSQNPALDASLQWDSIRSLAEIVEELERRVGDS